MQATLRPPVDGSYEELVEPSPSQAPLNKNGRASYTADEQKDNKSIDLKNLSLSLQFDHTKYQTFSNPKKAKKKSVVLWLLNILTTLLAQPVFVGVQYYNSTDSQAQRILRTLASVLINLGNNYFYADIGLEAWFGKIKEILNQPLSWETLINVVTSLVEGLLAAVSGFMYISGAQLLPLKEPISSIYSYLCFLWFFGLNMPGAMDGVAQLKCIAKDVRWYLEGFSPALWKEQFIYEQRRMLQSELVRFIEILKFEIQVNPEVSLKLFDKFQKTHDIAWHLEVLFSYPRGKELSPPTRSSFMYFKSWVSEFFAKFAIPLTSQMSLLLIAISMAGYWLGAVEENAEIGLATIFVNLYLATLSAKAIPLAVFTYLHKWLIGLGNKMFVKPFAQYTDRGWSNLGIFVVCLAIFVVSGFTSPGLKKLNETHVEPHITGWLVNIILDGALVGGTLFNGFGLCGILFAVLKNRLKSMSMGKQHAELLKNIEALEHLQEDLKVYDPKLLAEVLQKIFKEKKAKDIHLLDTCLADPNIALFAHLRGSQYPFMTNTIAQMGSLVGEGDYKQLNAAGKIIETYPFLEKISILVKDDKSIGPEDREKLSPQTYKKSVVDRGKTWLPLAVGIVAVLKSTDPVTPYVGYLCSWVTHLSSSLYTKGCVSIKQVVGQLLTTAVPAGVGIVVQEVTREVLKCVPSVSAEDTDMAAGIAGNMATAYVANSMLRPK